MKKKIIFNIGFILTIFACALLIWFSVGQLKNIVYFFNEVKLNPESFSSNINDLIKIYTPSIVLCSISLFLSVIVSIFSIYMLVYINKNDVSELAKSTKAFRQQTES